MTCRTARARRKCTFSLTSSPVFTHNPANTLVIISITASAFLRGRRFHEGIFAGSPEDVGCFHIRIFPGVVFFTRARSDCTLAPFSFHRKLYTVSNALSCSEGLSRMQHILQRS